jgi:hypothetical protein
MTCVYVSANTKHLAMFVRIIVAKASLKSYLFKQIAILDLPALLYSLDRASMPHEIQST